MRRICEKCDESYNDEFHSTICPHNGIGFCRCCDCVICVCAAIHSAYPEQTTQQTETSRPEDTKQKHGSAPERGEPLPQWLGRK